MSETTKDAAVQAEEELREDAVTEAASETADEAAESPAVTDGEVSEGGDEAAQSGMKAACTATRNAGKTVWELQATP